MMKAIERTGTANRRNTSARGAHVVVLAASALVACGGRGTGGAIGASTAPHAAAAAPSDAGASPAPSDAIPSDYKTALQKVTAARVPSVGHAPGRFDIEVYANDLGVAALAGASAQPGAPGAAAEAAVGTRFVVEHYERSGPNAGKLAAVMMMEKREKPAEQGDRDGGDRGDRDPWRYVVVGSTGQLVKDGSIEGCAGCHRDAPRDYVFRIGAASPGAK